MFRQRQAPMEPGLRTRSVTIQYRSSTDGAFPEDDWTTERSVTAWMSVEPVRASERFVAGQTSAKQELRFEMGYRADMDPMLVDVPRERRLVYQSRTYDILAAESIGMNEGVALITLSKVG